MKKSSFIALVLGTISGMMFAIGMCMCLLPQWNSFIPGVIFGSVGALLGIITVFVWRKMTNKAPIHISGRSIIAIIVGIIGALLLGAGMCFCLVWNKMVLGIIIGIVGIAVLFSLIPLIAGIKD